MSFLGTDRAGLYSRSDGLDSRTARLFGRALCQRCTGTPVQHLTGEQQFRSLRLRVAPGVFVPRPETEAMVDHALATMEGIESPVVVDVGTGTGAIALALKLERPDARVLATDVSEGAVTLASANAERHGLLVEVLRGDLLDPVPSSFRGAVDLVVSNPPYIAREAYEDLPEEVRADPYEALVGGTLHHARLAESTPTWLVPGGWLVMEIGADQGEEVRSLLSGRFQRVEVLPDLAGRDRVVRGRWPGP
jgi:release factor glutamine methyltransferase